MRELIRSVLLLGLLGISMVLPAHAQNWRTMTSSRQVWDRDPLRAEIHYGAGHLQVRPAEEPYLYQMEIRYTEEGPQPMAEYDAEDDVLRLGMDPRFERHGRHHFEEGEATIALTREVPIDLELRFGAGEADIDLGGVSLQKLLVRTGASETTLRFSQPNPIQAKEVMIQAGAADLRVLNLGNTRAERVEFEGGAASAVLDFSGAVASMEARVRMGAGSLTLRLPRSHGVRLSRNAFLASVSTPGMTRDGDSYYSANWASSQDRLTIDVTAALGSIEVQWVD